MKTSLNSFKPFCFFLAFIASLSLPCGFALVAAEEDTTTSGAKASIQSNACGKYALLVGVSDFQDPELDQLQYTVEDIKLIREELLKLGFDEDHITTLTSNSRASNLPTKSNIEAHFNRILAGLTSNDLIFLAFCGHGFQERNTIYFCAQDTLTDPGDPSAFQAATAFSISQVMNSLRNSPARFKWLFLDACRVDRTARASSEPSTIQTVDDPPRGNAYMFSCAFREKSYEDDSLGHGLFSYNFVEGLKGAADREGNDDGNLTLYELCGYVNNKTVAMAKELKNKSQRPYLACEESSDFIIIDGLLKDGLSREVWDEADGYYQEACLLRKNRRYREAQGKIGEALKLTERAAEGSSQRQMYLDEEADIKERLETEEKLAAAETARQKAEAEAARRLAEAERKLREAEERVRQSTGSQGVTPSISSAEPSEESDTFVSSTTPAARVSSLGKGTKAGDKKTITAKGIDYTFCWCPSGSFTMGSPESEEGRDDDETGHRVTLTRGFWLLESEVTQGMWQSVMGTTVSEQRDKSNYSFLSGVGSNYPMYYVNWDESVEFCRKLSALTGEKITLPTEAQWEYACRAGSKGPYAGTGKLDEMSWYNNNSGDKTHEVKGKQANAWGLYDMHGNVWEWCLDWKGDYPSGPVTDPEGPYSGSSRVIRGGGWSSIARNCRSANRSSNSPEYRISYLGLRPAAVPAD